MSGTINVDYGEHFVTLNYSQEIMNTDTQQSDTKKISGDERLRLWKNGEEMLPDGHLIVPNGSCSFGLVLDKQGSNHPSPLQPPSNTTGKKREYLIDLSKQLINLSYGNSSLTNNNSIHHKHLETMRFNLVKGARSLPHTDVLRSSLLPNYCFFLSPFCDRKTEFTLVVKKWPLFKTSIVSFCGQLMIPFEYRIGKEGDPFDYVNGKGGYLKTIVLNEEKMEAQWKVLNPILIDEFEPKFKLPQGKAVGGIADGKIYIISEKYKVYESWSHLNKIAWDEVLKNQNYRFLFGQDSSYYLT